MSPARAASRHSRSNYQITVADLRQALARQKTELRPGDVVFIRTGTLRHWGENGSDHAKLAAHDSAGITLETARWLVEENGAMMLGSDTSGLEYGPDCGRDKGLSRKVPFIQPGPPVSAD
jgi:kynurenine formamidase